MAKLSDVKEAIARYERTFRRSDVPKLKISGLYDLFPEEESTDIEVVHCWPEPWPYGERKGVYMFFTKKLKLLYVGVAYQGASRLKDRLNTYFDYRGYEPGDPCHPKYISGDDPWSARPSYVLTVAVPKKMYFEAPAVESFLIKELQPKDNVVGR